VIDALDTLYRDPAKRAALAQRGRQLVERPEFRWEAIGERFAEELDRACGGLQVAVSA
jgi:hypothetical protein